MKLIINTDGGGRYNNIVGYGPIAGAFVSRFEDGTYLASLNAWYEKGSNNEAEYQGVLLALRSLREIAAKVGSGVVTEIKFRSDSRLIVEQVSGRSPVKQKRLKDLLQCQVHPLLERITIPYCFVWVPRDQNSEADYLCNLALDGTVLTNMFEPLKVKLPKITGVSAGQLFRLGRLTEPRPLRVDGEGFALCGGCKGRIVACSCPPLEEAA